MRAVQSLDSTDVLSILGMLPEGEVATIELTGNPHLGKEGLTLYHGTALCNVESIMRDGIKPRGTGAATHPRMPSLNDRAYLTSWDALYYAFNSLKANYPLCTSIAVAEVKLSEQDFENLRADEDAVMALSSMCPPPANARLEMDWRSSFEVRGTVAHLGVIPPDRITRWVTYELTEAEIRALIEYRKYTKEVLSSVFEQNKKLRPSRLLRLLHPRHPFDDAVVDLIWQQQWGFTRFSQTWMMERLFAEQGVEPDSLENMHSRVALCDGGEATPEMVRWVRENCPYSLTLNGREHELKYRVRLESGVPRLQGLMKATYHGRGRRHFTPNVEMRRIKAILQATSDSFDRKFNDGKSNSPLKVALEEAS